MRHGASYSVPVSPCVACVALYNLSFPVVLSIDRGFGGCECCDWAPSYFAQVSSLGNPSKGNSDLSWVVAMMGASCASCITTVGAGLLRSD